MTIRIRPSAPATLAAGGRRYRLRARRTTLTIPLPARPASGPVQIRFSLRPRSSAVAGTLRGTLSTARL
jgi:hypothetical protein